MRQRLPIEACCTGLRQHDRHEAELLYGMCTFVTYTPQGKLWEEQFHGVKYPVNPRNVHRLKVELDARVELLKV